MWGWGRESRPVASFIAAIMQKLKAGRLYNLLVTARRNAEIGQWLSCLCPPPQGGDILHVPRFDIMLNDAYSFTRTPQKKKLSALAFSSRVERLESVIIWHISKENLYLCVCDPSR